MSDSESTPAVPAEKSVPVSSPEAARPSRWRRFFLRHLPLSLAGVIVLLAVSVTGLYFIASSAGFENLVRKHLVSELETATGGRVEIASFHWHLLGLEAEADGLVIHGLEAPGEAPYARADRLRVRASILSILSPRILLRDLEIAKPRVHLIVYPDGSTNQPQPRKRKKTGKPVLDQFFDLKAGRVEVEQGILETDNRASTFDFQDRRIPLDFTANDASLRMAYMPAAAGNPESYHIEAGVRDLNLTRGAALKAGSAGKAPQQVHGFLQATLDVTRTMAILRSLRLTASSHGVPDRTLEISGILKDFAHPRWQASVTGALDMRLLNPITGYPNAPEGIAHLKLTGAGRAGIFRADGSIHVEDGAYIGTGVIATGVGLDAHIHADAQQLLITSIFARLRQGGQIEGNLSLEHWLPTLPAADTLSTTASKSRSAQKQPAPSSSDITLPVNGKVTTQFKDVALDTLLEMVSVPPFQHLGFDTRINGPATALWINGDVRTLSVSTLLNLTPPAQATQSTIHPSDGSLSQERKKAPASGVVDATYTQRDGAVDLRKLELQLPSSHIEARGHLGAHPLTSPSALAVDFHSSNLSEFDTVLRDLGWTRNNRTGVAALPIALFGQADFHGTWSGSIVDPRLAGTVKATELAFEMRPMNVTGTGVPWFIRLDTIDTTGSYSAAKIDLSQGTLRSGNAKLAFSGSLTAAASGGSSHIPSFNANSLLHLRLRANKVDMNSLQPFINRSLPITGAIDAQLQVDGPLRTLGGSGWAEMDNARVYGEPVERIRAQGSIANRTVKLSSLAISEAGGRIAGTGSYDLASHRFQLSATGAEIDVARIEGLRRNGLAVTGKLGFSIEGTGTSSDPRLEAHATLSSLALGGEPMGELALNAHTANRAVTYDLTTRLETAELSMHGQTALAGDYATQARLDFSRFDIGALFKLAHVQGISGESALAGTVLVEGPLARPEQLRGDARLRQLAVTVAGVHLKSEGGLHATLDHAMIHLDSVHITGEETDLRAQGSLSLKNKQQLDFAANGAINLKIAETLDPDLTASGNTTFQMEAHGPLMHPDLRGRISFQNASLSLENVPNGLSQLHGTLEFNQDRLEVKSLTAVSGGGLLSLGGYLTYQHGLYASLSATGTGIRIRYPQGVSSQADASLRLQGPQNNLLLSGEVLITRFTLSPDLDIAALAAQTSSVTAIPPATAPSNHLRLNVHIGSSPQLNFQNAYAKLAGNVDLRLRGTAAQPSLLGRISITEGSGIIAGTRYELQRGDINFTNPVRIEPTIDLNATARVEDYDISLGLHGTPQKLSASYRSDPPLPEADVVALLALGRTGNQQRLYTQQQQQALANPTTDSLLGGALNATVSSRVQKLFGSGNVKVDPNYLGSLGNSTSRIIVEEQLGSKVTLTYATNVNTTAQQLLQADIAINRHVSLQLARDESGVFSVVLKATRRYR
jgi:translocation and assembly module TamB